MSDTKETKDVPTNEAAAATVIQAQPKRRWVSYFWDTFDKSKEERRFLFKLDAALLTISCLGPLQCTIRDTCSARLI
jgi:hypothetical protein